MAKTITEKERDNIVRLYIELGTYDAVHHKTGYSTTTIWRAVSRAGLGRGMGGNQDAQKKFTDDELLTAIKTMTAKEIAEKWSVHENTVYRRCRNLGVKAVASGDRLSGLKQNWGTRTDNLLHQKSGYDDCWHFISSQQETFEKKHPGFIYLETRKKRVRMKCKRCGSVIERANSTLWCKGIVCEFCSQQKTQKNELQDERIKLMRFFIALKQSKTPKICACCGEVFYSKYSLSTYCSEKCKMKAKKQRQKERDPEKYREKRRIHAKGSKHIRRAKKYGVEYENGITLAKVILKNNNVCQICGRLCDKTDKVYGSAGPNYPSIDHIKPLSKGGTHTWNNVQLAHMMCNSVKSDNYTVKREEVRT